MRGRGAVLAFYLGTDTPLESVAEAARTCDPTIVVISAVDARAFRRQAEALTGLAREARLCLGGCGTAKARLETDVVLRTEGPVEEAERLTQLAARWLANSDGHPAQTMSK